MEIDKVLFPRILEPHFLLGTIMTPVTSNISTCFVSSAQNKSLCLLCVGAGDGEARV